VSGFLYLETVLSVINQNIIFSTLRVSKIKVTRFEKLFISTEWKPHKLPHFMLSFYLIMFVLPVLVIGATIWLATKKPSRNG